jgi:DNA polymerase-4
VGKAQLNRIKIENLGSDDSNCHILHVDMDAFYASVEVRRDPSLAGKPVIVGGSEGRGVVVAATYEARAFGIHAAMPMSRAMRLCPQAIVVAADHAQYAEVSDQIYQILISITPFVETIALDEAFLDISGSIKLLGRPVLIATKLREQIKSELALTASVGVASNKFLAKLASTYAKPDGLLVIPEAKKIDFLHPLPVGALWGVGEKTEEKLKELGINTIGDIAKLSEETLARIVGDAAAEHIYELCWGIDDREVVTTEIEKSIGNETTFGEDLFDATEVEAQILRLVDQVAARLRSRNLSAKTISLKVRFHDFTTITRSKTLSSYTHNTQEINQVARQLYRNLNLQRARIRLLGIRAESLQPTESATFQLSLDQAEQEWDKADSAIDRARAKFGSAAIKPARLISEPE